MESKVFYEVKITRLVAIVEAHKAIEGAKNVVNVAKCQMLLPNAGDSGNQKSNTEEVSAESIKKIYKPAGELEIEEDLESDHEVELPLPARTTRRRQELPRWKRISEFGKAF